MPAFRGRHILTPVLTLALAATVLGQGISVRAVTDRNEAYVGEAIRFQIQVTGSDAPEPPDLTAVKDFQVQFEGGSKNNSTSVQIIGGRMSRVESRGYVFSYALVPNKAGELVIPPIAVKVEGKTLTTRGLAVRAREPQETDDVRLRLSLSKDRCYVGEPVTLTVTWAIRRQVNEYDLRVPVLLDGRFRVADVREGADPAQRDAWQALVVNQEKVAARTGRLQENGEEYATFTFRKVLVPKQAGALRLPKATVSCSMLMGHDRRRPRDPFEDFFGGPRGVWRRVVAPSNEPVLDVRDMPAEGRPRDFAGLAGSYSIQVSAVPTEVSVGDPITLTIRVTASEFVDDVELPPPARNAELTRDFKTPQEMAAPKVEGNVKTWTQTVRATQAQVTQIPPFELPYFDAAKGVYSVARSEPVPIKVRPTEVVTAKDAEGGTEAQPERAPLKAWQEGITHNYEGLDVIEETSSGLATWIRSPAWLALLAGPPAAYGLLLAGVLLARRRNADPAAAESRRALPMLRRDLRRGHDDPPAAAQALKRYLGRKLHVPSGAMTSADACREIEAAGLEATLAREIRDLLERCEAHRYARGAAGAADLDDLRRRVARLARQVERGLR